MEKENMGNTVSIGKGTYMNSNVTLVDDHEISIGENVLIAPNVTICTTNHPMHYLSRPHGEMYCRKVVIEDYVWIGSNAVICPGVTVGRGAVIGAGSVVTKDIPPMCFAAGVPCRVIREITEEECVFNLSQIGELCRVTEDAFISKHPEIPWREMYGLRNRIVLKTIS